MASWTLIGGGVIGRIFVVDVAGFVKMPSTKERMFAMKVSRGTWT
jgi:hypothetical protein